MMKSSIFVKSVVASLSMLFLINASASAMTFSQPVEIGWMGMNQKSGGFSCKNESIEQ